MHLKRMFIKIYILHVSEIDLHYLSIFSEKFFSLRQALANSTSSEDSH
jgi:hypothetical protein